MMLSEKFFKAATDPSEAIEIKIYCCEKISDTYDIPREVVSHQLKTTYDLSTINDVEPWIEFATRIFQQKRQQDELKHAKMMEETAQGEHFFSNLSGGKDDDQIFWVSDLKRSWLHEKIIALRSKHKQKKSYRIFMHHLNRIHNNH